MLNEIQEILEAKEPSEVAEFQQQMLVQYCNAYDQRIIGAAYVILEGKCDEDDQHGFRGWLISQGELFFKKVLDNPDVLAESDIVPSRIYMPDMIGLGAEVYQEMTGERPPADPDFQFPSEPSGEEFDLSEMHAKLPNLCDEWGFEFESPGDESSEPVDPVMSMLAAVDSQVKESEQVAVNAADDVDDDI